MKKAMLKEYDCDNLMKLEKMLKRMKECFQFDVDDYVLSLVEMTNEIEENLKKEHGMSQGKHIYEREYKNMHINGTMQKNLIELQEALRMIQMNSDYDVETYVVSLLHQTKQIEYFYCVVAKKCDGEPFYHIHRRPKVHQLAYFNIGRGFPKELHDGHWCYIVRDTGAKMLVIPCTSIKPEMKEMKNYELDIQVSLQKFQISSRMQLADMKMVDVQRIDLRKSFLDVITEKSVIDHSIYQFVFNEK